jgi:hypothetical protein
MVLGVSLSCERRGGFGSWLACRARSAVYISPPSPRRWNLPCSSSLRRQRIPVAPSSSRKRDVYGSSSSRSQGSPWLVIPTRARIPISSSREGGIPIALHPHEGCVSPRSSSPRRRQAPSLFIPTKGAYPQARHPREGGDPGTLSCSAKYRAFALCASHFSLLAHCVRAAHANSEAGPKGERRRRESRKVTKRKGFPDRANQLFH